MSYKALLKDAARGSARGALQLVFKTVTSTNSSYQPGGDPVSLAGDFKEVKVALVEASGGYVARATSYSGAAFKVQLFYVPDPTTISGSNSVLTEVVSGTNISGTVYNIVAIGYV